MAAVLLILLLALILGGAGFAVHILWWIALIVIALWLIGFAFGHSSGRGWYGRRW